MKIIGSAVRKLSAIIFVFCGVFALVDPRPLVFLAIAMAACTFIFVMVGDPYAEDRKK